MESQHRNEDELKSADETNETGSLQGSANEFSRSAKHKKEGGAYKEIVEWIKALVIAVVLVFVIRQFLFSPFIVDGDSMQPNFETSERLIVNKILYDIREPKFGEVIVFDVPEQDRKFIKRVIGVPGDKVRLEGDDLYINDVLVEEPYIKDAIEAAHAEGRLYNTEKDFPNESVTETTVPEDTIFVLGDNRGNSTDSRVIGFVKDEEIVGRADVIFWPLDKLSFIKHRY
ncbi:signal peptidase I [Paenibacillus soyae]|uniref:Signal peptidase I n=1 Tax=Paenibacillus soyae TaxID=2969249 RepID=A0A9X2MRE1_9BACL|nr:signal peptidase I [Paenibacillus soyae]MCR2804990.1 signal peptidase I [Paenibacillus soyae]